MKISNLHDLKRESISFFLNNGLIAIESPLLGEEPIALYCWVDNYYFHPYLYYQM